MIAVIAVIFGMIAIVLLIILAGLTCIGWFGLTNKVKELVNKLLVRSHDQEYRNIERVAINTECYICLQAIQYPTIASCNHSFCGTFVSLLSELYYQVD